MNYFENCNVRVLDRCVACDSKNLQATLDLNNQPLANSYKNNRDDVQEFFPLAVNRCMDCFHVQLTHAVNPELMFKDYLYVSGTSQTMRDHFKWFANYVFEYYNMINKVNPKNVFDIGCNDGTQLDYFKNLSVNTYGIDPAVNLHEKSSKNHEVYCDFFNNQFVKKHMQKYDVIIAQNVFAHNYDPISFLYSIKNIMNDNSLLFIQTSQSDMIKNNEFDTIYHEHISFYNINSMNELCKRANVHLIDVEKCPLHGNSYIFIISKNEKNKRVFNIDNHIFMEQKIGLLTNQTYVDYAKKCNQIVQDLQQTLEKYKHYKIVGYGAAAKGMTLLNYSKIHLDWIIDDNPLKQNKFTPGSSIPILSSDTLKKYSDNTIVFVPLAWNFFEEIKTKIKSIRPQNKDLFVTYFPKVEVRS